MAKNISKRRKDAPADAAVIEKARYLARQRLEAEPLTLSAGIKLERADRESLSKSYYEYAHREGRRPAHRFFCLAAGRHQVCAWGKNARSR